MPPIPPIPPAPDALPFTVGVEIEFSTANMPELSFARYSGVPWEKVPGGWRLKTDGSCGVRDGVYGYELVSPILRTVSDLEQIVRVVRYLLEHNATVNERCGLHVHIGGLNRKSQSQRNNLFNFLVRYEEAFFSLADSTRQDNRYCRRIYPEIVINLRRGLGFDAWEGVHDARYQWLNGAAYNKYGTLEFRIMGSLLNPDFIKGWVNTLLQVADSQVNNRKHNRRLHKSKCESKEFLIHDLLQQINCYGKTATERAVNARKWVAERFNAVHGYSYRTHINQVMREAKKAKENQAAVQSDTWVVPPLVYRPSP